MIPSTTTIAQVDELPALREIEFGIGDPRWTMRTQARLYSDRETAVTREYSTNAYDANIERAKRLGIAIPPVEVTLPSDLHRFFEVRDRGDGMSEETLATVYTQFGVSPKRESNDYNGMLGYGCKSALAYTNTFTVISVHEGMRIEAVAVRRPDWSIVLKIVTKKKTDEESGTRVIVPVSNPDEFRTKAKNFYKFWMPGTVLVNGQEPEHYVGRKIIDGLYASPNYGTSYVVMGNVPYKIENPQALFVGSKMKYFHFVAYVDNGDVEFTPAREALEYTTQTKTALKAIFTNLEQSVLASATKEIEAAKTPAEAFMVWSDWRNHVGFGLFDDLTYKGKRLEPMLDIHANVYTISTYNRSMYRISQYDITKMPTTMIVTEFDINPSTAVRTKAREFLKHKGWNDVTTVLFTAKDESSLVSEWIPRDKIVTWKSIKDSLPKKPRTTTSVTGRPTGSWDYYDGFVCHAGKPIPSSGKLFYVTTHEFNRYHPGYVMGALKMTGIVIKVPGNRLEKFKRDYPTIQNLWTVAKSRVTVDGEKLLSDEAKEVLSIDRAVRRIVSNLDLSRLDDPEFKRLADVIADEDNLLKKYRDNFALAQSLNLRYYVREYKPQTASNYFTENYPLVSQSYGVTYGDDEYIYMNAKYNKVLADRKKND